MSTHLKLYVALESGKVDMDDLAPCIKELRNHQNELQRLRDNLIERMESDESAQIDKNEMMSYVNELEQIF